MKASEGSGATLMRSQTNETKYRRTMNASMMSVLSWVPPDSSLLPRKDIWLIGTPSTLPSPRGTFAHLSPVILSPPRKPMLWITT